MAMSLSATLLAVVLMAAIAYPSDSGAGPEKEETDYALLSDGHPGAQKGSSLIATGRPIMGLASNDGTELRRKAYSAYEDGMELFELEELEDSVLLHDDGPAPAADVQSDELALKGSTGVKERGADISGARSGLTFLFVAVVGACHLWRRQDPCSDGADAAATGDPSGDDAGTPGAWDHGGGDRQEHREPWRMTAPGAGEVDDFGCTALHVAANGGRASEVQKLLDAGFNPNAREAAWDEAPLHFAARVGSTESCKILVEHGAQVNPENDSGHTPLLVAAAAGKELTCKFLLDSGGHVGGMADSDLPPLLSALLIERVFDAGGGAEEAAVSAAGSSSAEK